MHCITAALSLYLPSPRYAMAVSTQRAALHRPPPPINDHMCDVCVTHKRGSCSQFSPRGYFRRIMFVSHRGGGGWRKTKRMLLNRFIAGSGAKLGTCSSGGGGRPCFHTTLEVTAVARSRLLVRRSLSPRALSIPPKLFV